MDYIKDIILNLLSSAIWAGVAFLWAHLLKQKKLTAAPDNRKVFILKKTWWFESRSISMPLFIKALYRLVQHRYNSSRLVRKVYNNPMIIILPYLV